MAHSYKNIIITPYTGNTNNDPRIVFSGGNTSVNTDVTLKVYPDSNGTLSFEGSAGQLFSITNDLSGSIFSVNDVSGLPIIDVNANSSTSIIGRSFQSNTAPALSITDTWANSSLNFTAIRANVANTDSGSGSLLMDLQVGGTSRFNINRNGDTVFAGQARGSSIFDGAIQFSTVGYGSILVGDNGGQGATFRSFVAIGGGTGGGPAAGVHIRSDSSLAWSSTTSVLSTPDLILVRDSANTLAQRNGTAPQTFNLYNTYTDASNYERLSVAWSSNICSIRTNAAGSGVGTRQLVLGTNNLSLLALGVLTVGAWNIADNGVMQGYGNLLFGTDNTYDIGASGANRPRDIYVAGTVYAAAAIRTGNIYAGTGGSFAFGDTLAMIKAGPNNASITLLDTNQATFDRLQFGGMTSAFPALKRVASGNVLRVTAADDSNNAGFVVGTNKLATTATDGFLYIPSCDGTPTGTPTTQANTVPIVVDTTNNKLYFYSGGAWRDAGP